MITMGDDITQEKIWAWKNCDGEDNDDDDCANDDDFFAAPHNYDNDLPVKEEISKEKLK